MYVIQSYGGRQLAAYAVEDAAFVLGLAVREFVTVGVWGLTGALRHSILPEDV